MENHFILLTEKEYMWAEMLIQVLKDNGVIYIAEPVFGAAFSLKTGACERYKIYVPGEFKSQAEELLLALFPEDPA